MKTEPDFVNLAAVALVPRQKDADGFTLLEILIAFFLFTIIMSALYTSYAGVFSVVNRAQREGELYQMARVTLERMNEDLESTFFVPPDGAHKDKSKQETQQASSLFRFEGQKDYTHNHRTDSLTFSSTAFVTFTPEERTPGLTTIRYWVEETGEENEKRLTLFRGDQADLGWANKEASAEKEGGFPLCDDLYSLTLSYTDGEGNTAEVWDATSEESKGKPPRAVTIQLMLTNDADPERPYLFETMVLLP